MSLDALRSLVQSELNATDQLISQQFDSAIPLINQLSQHITHSGGKRLRPILVLLGAKAFGYTGDAHIRLAAVIELIHTATLLHDDVVDASELRRGQKTANALWGNEASILVGDYVYSRAFQLMASTQSLPVLSALIDATNVIAEGEVLQLLNRNNPSTTEAQYMETIRYKTGTLFAAASQLGAILCERPAEEIQAMRQYGLHLGIAFQLVDDALDYHASAEVIGKCIGNDLAEGKMTLPLIHALRQGSSEQIACITEAIEHNCAEHLSELLGVIESTKAIPYTYEAARQQVSLAIGSLAIVPASPYRDALLALAEFTATRGY